MGRRGDDRAPFDRRDGERLHAGPTGHAGTFPPRGGSGISRATFLGDSEVVSAPAWLLDPTTWEVPAETPEQQRARDPARALRSAPVFVLPERETHTPYTGTHALRARLAHALHRTADRIHPIGQKIHDRPI